MTLGTALALCALAASLYLVMSALARPYAVTAAVASGLQVATAFGLLSIRIANVPLRLVFALAIAVCGGVLFAKARAKGHVAAATIITVVGVIGLASALRLLR